MPNKDRRVPARRSSGISILRSDGQQVQEEWALWEQLAVLEQVGALGR